MFSETCHRKGVEWLLLSACVFFFVSGRTFLSFSLLSSGEILKKSLESALFSPLWNIEKIQVSSIPLEYQNAELNSNQGLNLLARMDGRMVEWSISDEPKKSTSTSSSASTSFLSNLVCRTRSGNYLEEWCLPFTLNGISWEKTCNVEENRSDRHANDRQTCAACEFWLTQTNSEGTLKMVGTSTSSISFVLVSSDLRRSLISSSQGGDEETD